MREQWLQALRAAFPDGGCPERPIIRCRCEECQTADTRIGGRSWADVAADFPAECHHAYPLLTHLSQQYYLPAFMASALGGGGMQGESVEYALLEGSLHPAEFTPMQRTVVLQWMTLHWAEVGEVPPESLVSRWRTATQSRQAEPGATADGGGT